MFFMSQMIYFIPAVQYFKMLRQMIIIERVVFLIKFLFEQIIGVPYQSKPIIIPRKYFRIAVFGVGIQTI